MELLLLVFLLTQVLGHTQQQLDADGTPDIQVHRFSWSRHRPSMLSDDRNLNDNTTLSQTISQQGISRREVENRNSIETQSRELRDVEQSAIRESVRSKPVDMYTYRVELKNRGTREVRGIVWDYQTIELSDPENPSHRQFRCEVKMKPNGSARLEAFSILPPHRVISAINEGKKPTERIIINRVDYADGGFWQRDDWHPPERVAGQKNKRERCHPI
jgi:hypothetical protein